MRFVMDLGISTATNADTIHIYANGNNGNEWGEDGKPGKSLHLVVTRSGGSFATIQGLDQPIKFDTKKITKIFIDARGGDGRAGKDGEPGENGAPGGRGGNG